MHNKATILLYHGVTSAPSTGIENFSRKHLPGEEFDRQMEFVSKEMHVMTLREMATALERGLDLPERAVCVTFDDGAKNTREVALPILKRHAVPATFFVTTGFIGTQRLYWVDQVEHTINSTQQQSVDFPIGGTSTRFPLSSAQERIAAVVTIKAELKKLPPADRDGCLTHLREQTQIWDNGQNVANYVNMDWNDVASLHKPPHYEVGGHSVNHEILAYLDDDRLHYEVFQCKRDLEMHLGAPIDLYSYPEGQATHFNERVIAELKRAGITICPSAIHGFNYPGENPFYLKRIMVGFMGEAFPFDARPATGELV